MTHNFQFGGGVDATLISTWRYLPVEDLMQGQRAVAYILGYNTIIYLSMSGFIIVQEMTSSVTKEIYGNYLPKVWKTLHFQGMVEKGSADVQGWR